MIVCDHGMQVPVTHTWRDGDQNMDPARQAGIGPRRQIRGSGTSVVGIRCGEQSAYRECLRLGLTVGSQYTAFAHLVNATCSQGSSERGTRLQLEYWPLPQSRRSRRRVGNAMGNDQVLARSCWTCSLSQRSPKSISTGPLPNVWWEVFGL